MKRPQTAPTAGTAHRASQLALVTLALIGLAGCSLPEHRGNQGWVAAYVMAVGGSFPEPLRPEDDCRTQAKPDDQFAQVGFRWRRSMRWRIVRLPHDGLLLRKNDYVRVNLDDCATPVQKYP